jgi:hypothetical protein
MNPSLQGGSRGPFSFTSAPALIYFRATEGRGQSIGEDTARICARKSRIVVDEIKQAISLLRRHL